MAELKGNEPEIEHIAFSLDNTKLISGAKYEKHRTWNLTPLYTSGEELLKQIKEKYHLKLDGVTVKSTWPRSYLTWTSETIEPPEEWFAKGKWAK